MLVARGDSVVLRRAYGGDKGQLTAESAFWIASITKSFTSAAILELQRQGKLSVNDPLSRFFPEAPADKRAITIHQLLTHTAGLAGNFSGSGIVDRTKAVEAILNKPLEHPPGRGYRYGDDDYELLAAVVEMVTGGSWQDYVQHALLDPLGLKQTGFWGGSFVSIPPPVPGADGKRSAQPDAGGHADWSYRGANGMSATADDLWKWSRAWQGRLGKTGQTLSEIPHVAVRQEPPFQVSYGYGVRLYSRNDRIVEAMFSGSGDDGHSAVIRQLASGVTMVVLSNAGQHEGTSWSAFVASQIASRE